MLRESGWLPREGRVPVTDFLWSDPAVRPREAALADAGFASIGELRSDRSQFETWSQYALRALFA